MYAQVKQAQDGQWYFVIKGDNNEVIATGETYTTKEDAIRGTEQFNLSHVDVHDDVDGR